MALITLTSASGSPGVTTTAVGLALSWPRPVLLVEADPTGGSAIGAGYLRGGAAPTDSLIDLAFAHRDGALLEAIPSVTATIPDTSVTLIPGTRAHGQARSLTGLWEPLAAALKSSGRPRAGRHRRRRPARAVRVTGAADPRRGPGAAGHPVRPGRAVRGPLVGADPARPVRGTGRGDRVGAAAGGGGQAVHRPRGLHGAVGAGDRRPGVGRTSSRRCSPRGRALHAGSKARRCCAACAAPPPPSKPGSQPTATSSPRPPQGAPDEQQPHSTATPTRRRCRCSHHHRPNAPAGCAAVSR